MANDDSKPKHTTLIAPGTVPDEEGMVVFRKPGYLDRLTHQSKQWAEGNPQHNYVDDECCPDFSCCHPSLLMPEHERMRFLEADGPTRTAILAGCLGKMLEASGHGVVYTHGEGVVVETDEEPDPSEAVTEVDIKLLN